jgi:branched-chain amino acid transport system permease protein
MPVFMTVMGGPFNFLGPLIGSAIYTLLMAFVTSFTEYWPMVSGIVIIVVVLVMPGGLLGLLGDKLPFLRQNGGSVKETNG